MTADMLDSGVMNIKEIYDYLSLAKSNGRWVIVNVLWRLQKPPAPPRQ